MIENIYNDGGRKLFNEDLAAIEEHLISVQAIFASEAPFIISGMTYTDLGGDVYDISSGYVWLDGKIRSVSAQSSLDLSGNVRIITNDTDSDRVYEDGATKVASTEYGITVEAGVASGNSQLQISDVDNIRRYYDNVLGDQFVTLDSNTLQDVLSNVKFSGTTTFSGTISSTSNITGAIITATDKVVSTNGYEVSGGVTAINANGTVGTNRVVTDSIADNNVTRGHIQDNAIGSDQIDANAVGNSELNANAVSESKIQSNAVTDAKLSTSAKNLFVNSGEIPVGYTQLKTAVFEIGTWDMTSVDNKNVSTALPNTINLTISSISAIIYSDDGSHINELTRILPNGGWIDNVLYTGGFANILLKMQPTGFFDSIDYNGSGNRGYVSITYME